MQMRPQLQIQTLIKAMTEDVIPALDQTNQLAMQSAQLTVGTLALLAQHLPLQYRFDTEELSGLLDAAASLRALLHNEPGLHEALSRLQRADESGSDVLQRARAEPSELITAVQSLRAATAYVVEAAYRDGCQDAQATVRRIVMDLSKTQLLRDRSWLLLQGWEPDVTAVPPITQLLRVPGPG